MNKEDKDKVLKMWDEAWGVAEMSLELNIAIDSIVEIVIDREKERKTR